MDNENDIKMAEEFERKKRARSVNDFKTLRRKYEELQAFKAKYYKGIHTSNKVMHEIAMRWAEIGHISTALDFPEFWLSLDLIKGRDVPDLEI